MKEEREEVEVSGYKDYVAGLLAGVSTVVVGHPFDTVKVKLQKHNTEAHGIKYKNGLHCAARILSNEGVRGLYRGATSSFIGVSFESSLLFGMYSQTKQSLQRRLQRSDPDPLVIIPSAAAGGAMISFILCPSELVKCRMQVQGTDSLIPKSSRYSGPLDCAVRTIKTEGVSGIFRGGVATLFRESLGNAMFFGMYENVRHLMHSKLKSASHDHKGMTDIGIGILSGGLGGVAFWSAVLPLDVAKTIIQTDPDRSGTRNPFRVLHSVYRRAGIRGCYAGLGPTILRAFPANAAAIVTWEFAMKILGIRHD
ncbi:Mitochondrial arginine transporter BAC1-like protein [Drosera capensis]